MSVENVIDREDMSVENVVQQQNLKLKI